MQKSPRSQPRVVRAGAGIPTKSVTSPSSKIDKFSNIFGSKATSPMKQPARNVSSPVKVVSPSPKMQKFAKIFGTRVGAAKKLDDEQVELIKRLVEQEVRRYLQ